MTPSLRNWGLANATYNTQTNKLTINSGKVIKVKPNKKLKQNIQDLYSATNLYSSLIKSFSNADVISIELPHGSQSSRAMVSYALCIGVVGSLLHSNQNVVPVSANQVKQAIGSDRPSKQDVINWVKLIYPEVNQWLPVAVSTSEHICDAIVSIHILIQTKQFKEYINGSVLQSI